MLEPKSLEDQISVNERSPKGITALGDFGSVHPSRERSATVDGHEGTRAIAMLR
ncbi:MAG: hypothetical protein IPK70_15070 [Flavobacteriales bacterium]|nr:hypothetical protein [Flavobacteriales bacterium]